MIVRILLMLLCLTLSACSARQASQHLPGGYNVWVMNAQEIYLADRNKELLVGPGLRSIGITKEHIVAFSDPPSSGYIGNLRTDGYSVLDVSTGDVSTRLSKQEAQALLTSKGESFPEMLSFDAYPVTNQ